MKFSFVLAAAAFLALCFSSCTSTGGSAATGVGAGEPVGSPTPSQAQQYYGPAN